MTHYFHNRVRWRSRRRKQASQIEHHVYATRYRNCRYPSGGNASVFWLGHQISSCWPRRTRRYSSCAACKEWLHFSLKALEAKYGWLHVVSTRENATAYFDQLGKTREIEKNPFKPYPC